MESIDNNFLIRYFVKDDESQYKIVEKIFGDIEAQNKKIFIPDIVLVELVWVLKSGYGIEKHEIIQVLKIITTHDLFEFSEKSILLLTIEEFETSTGDFADYLKENKVAKNQSLPVYSIDKKLKSSINFKVL